MENKCREPCVPLPNKADQPWKKSAVKRYLSGSRWTWIGFDIQHCRHARHFACNNNQHFVKLRHEAGRFTCLIWDSTVVEHSLKCDISKRHKRIWVKLSDNLGYDNPHEWPRFRDGPKLFRNLNFNFNTNFALIFYIKIFLGIILGRAEILN